MPMCAMCEQEVERWLPHLGRSKFSPFPDVLGCVSSDLANHLCPLCNCNDRERHIWLYMAASGVLSESVTRPVLHVAPERQIEGKLRNLVRGEYIAGDLSPRDPRHARVDIENLAYPDGKFHLIICNNVLEYVCDPRRAIRELARCLADDGWLVAQTPYAALLRDTMEFTVAPSRQQAEFFFGQDDHVRLFGANIGDYFAAAGLQGALYSHDSVLPGVDVATCGCNAREPFFLFSKTRTLGKP